MLGQPHVAGMKYALRLALPAIFAGSVVSSIASAAPPEPAPARGPYSTRGSVMAGLNQWLLFGGGNIAGQLKVGRWFVAELSHGQQLNLGRVSFALTEAERDAGVSVVMPWTTGGGVGLQITPNLHVLLELKAHRYEVRGFDRNQSTSYTSFTVGPGVFYDLYLYQGFFIQPSARWWPTVASTYDEATFDTKAGGSYTHSRHDLTPFVNLNIGWTMTGI
jgi:hypothetical protein